jgi:ubiquinone/menaquinone biosynthesis C-methylase UbiE
MNLKQYNKVSVPIFEFNPDGSIKPNPLFHRSWDKLHSRCIEYPYAASKLTDEKRILDVGTAKADKAWIDWLEALPIEVHGTDYDEMNVPLKRMKFTQGDVRKLPYKDNYFDAIMAVSVIEHIGLDDAQVNAVNQPEKSDSGDVEAVKELKRILKPGGKLIMTFPYSEKNFIFSGSARVYDLDRISKFNQLFDEIQYEYYEYQYRNEVKHNEEYQNMIAETKEVSLSRRIINRLKRKKVKDQARLRQIATTDHIMPGVVTWRKIDIENCSSTQQRHIDGVYCGVWKKLI